MYDFGFSQKTHMFTAKSYVEIRNLENSAYLSIKAYVESVNFYISTYDFVYIKRTAQTRAVHFYSIILYFLLAL